jgi:hypothetical protein
LPDQPFKIFFEHFIFKETLMIYNTRPVRVGNADLWRGGGAVKSLQRVEYCREISKYPNIFIGMNFNICI